VSAVETGAHAQRGEVAAGARLAEALAPDLVGGQHGRDETAPLLLAAVVDQSGAEQADAEEVGNLWRVGAGDLFLEDGLLHLSGAAATPFGGPAHAEIAGLVELALPLAAQLDQAVLGGLRVAYFLAPGALEVGLQPGAQLVAKLQVLFGQSQIHGESF